MRKYDAKYNTETDFDDADIMEEGAMDEFDSEEDETEIESEEDEEEYEEEDPVLAAKMPEIGEDADDVEDIEQVEKIVKRRGRKRGSSNDDDYLSGPLAVHRKLPQDAHPTQEKLKKIYNDYHSGDPDKKDAATTAMLGIMTPYILSRITKKYRSYMNNHLEDLQAQGYVGVLKGLPAFDPEKGRPTTWFVRYIDHEIQLYISKQIHNSSTYYANHSKQVYACIEERTQSGIGYTVEDIMIETGLPKKTIEKIINIKETTVVPMEGEVSGTLKSDYETPEEAIIREEAEELIHNLLRNTSGLTYEERVCVMLRYNIQDPDTDAMDRYLEYVKTHDIAASVSDNDDSDDDDFEERENSRKACISMNTSKMHSFAEVELLAKAIYGLDITQYMASRLVPSAIKKLQNEFGRQRRAKACHRIRTELQSNLTGDMISKVTMKKDQEAVAEFFDTGILKI